MKKIDFNFRTLLVLVLLIVMCLIATITEAAQTLDVPEKYQRGWSQKQRYDLFKEIQTDLTDLYTDYRASLSHFVNGPVSGGTVFVIESNQHIKMTLKSGFVTLAEAPDSSSKTYTVYLANSLNEHITDTLTFTQGTDAAGDAKAFTLVTGRGILDETMGLRAVIGGTTATSGEIVISTEWKGSP